MSFSFEAEIVHFLLTQSNIIVSILSCKLEYLPPPSLDWNSLIVENVLYHCTPCRSRAFMFSHVWLFAIPWTAACQVPLSMKFPRQEYWSRLPFPTPGDLPNSGIETTSLVSPALAGRFFTTEGFWPDKLLTSLEWTKEGKHISEWNNNNEIKILGSSLRSSMPICGSKKNYYLQKHLIKRIPYFHTFLKIMSNY